MMPSSSSFGPSAIEACTQHWLEAEMLGARVVDLLFRSRCAVPGVEEQWSRVYQSGRSTVDCVTWRGDFTVGSETRSQLSR
jgi:hypothetical protein